MNPKKKKNTESIYIIYRYTLSAESMDGASFFFYCYFNKL